MKPDQQRMIFGLLLLAILAGLAAVIAMGKIEEKTSYGLIPLLTTLSTVAGAFANWAFGTKSKDDKDS